MKNTNDNATERQKRAKRKIAIMLVRLKRLGKGLEGCSQVTAAVKAVVGEEQDSFEGVDEHPGSLDLP
jgi:hypothetical protein